MFGKGGCAGKEVAKALKKSGVIDKTYIEPGTGRWFRSLVAVERYLTEANEEVPNISSGSCHQQTKSSAEIEPQNAVSSTLKRNISGENDRPSKLNIGMLPAIVKWVLRGPGGNM
ncbi:methyl-CpG-binding domain-containing protein 7-like [Pyrus ussuriensis x Pyrus communis]|uniref:Methyl-CpG-binding domain-containing protein 7-like n=1 Tax=Pyrus ussuriensis x Pyrus communis TaxID=2448454 RepID=A0A5N5G890_9ROSA|nr:methyl-CpG-binding domain-containing protein 7-like [Pyrus ussuriensis x Pyrus communis]